MNRTRLAVILLVPVVLLASCADSKQVAMLEKRVSELETNVRGLKTSVETLEEKVKTLEEQKSLDELTKGWEAIAYLTPGSEGYSVVETDLGRVTVKLVNVQPYANGSRVTLQFGNMLSATINGAKAQVEWGSVDEKGSPRNESAKSREVKFSEALRAGAWTNVQVVLEGVPPTDLGFVRIKEMTHTGVTLLR